MVDEVIHQSMRLKIMAALAAGGRNDWIEFPRLKTLVGATDGNLGAHLETLSDAGYVTQEKRFEGKRPQTRIKATAAGRKAFADHVAYLRSILDNS
ncbi:MAG TPA: transcriptional regulator [Rhizomicrobium sp.]|jgi:DNA-binding MarR family transcriptional regulator|nr:transcriptional regulator [Rhizomicrobium sp.]